MAMVSIWMEERFDCIVFATSSSLDLVREARIKLKPLAASCAANSFPRPSDAPVTTAQEPMGPNEES